jgi:hypothetical protein
MEIRTINPEIALEGGGKEFYQEIRKSGNQEWRDLGRLAGIECRRNHETHQKHEMKEVMGLQFLFSHPSAFRDFRVFRGSPSLAASSPSW